MSIPFPWCNRLSLFYVMIDSNINGNSILSGLTAYLPEVVVSIRIEEISINNSQENSGICRVSLLNFCVKTTVTG